MRRFPRVFGLTVFILSLSSPFEAVAVTSISHHCPHKFVGTVSKVADSEAPFTSFALQKVNVNFKVQKVLEGSVGAEQEVQVLKHGSHRFSEGDQYQVELKDNLICKLQKLDS